MELARDDRKSAEMGNPLASLDVNIQRYEDRGKKMKARDVEVLMTTEAQVKTHGGEKF